MNINEMQKYLNQYYLTTCQLLKKNNISEGELNLLVKNKCVPPASYSLKTNYEYVSCLNQKTVEQAENYYHPSISIWIEQVKTLRHKHAIPKIAEIIKDRFYADYKSAFPENEETPNCDSVHTAWKYLMQGIWGICLREISVEYIALKQKARKCVSEISKMTRSNSLTKQQKNLMVKAINDYEKATMPFDPYFRPLSSRTNEILPAIKRFNL